MEIKISDISNLGHGIGFVEGKKIFIPKTVTGDIVKAEISLEKSKFTIAKLKEIIKPSPKRQDPECEYFAKCGGCSLQHLEPKYYQEFKLKNITDLLERNSLELTEDIRFIEIGDHSRRRVKFQIQNNALGFYQTNSHDLVKINHCLMLTKGISALIKPIEKILESLTSRLIKNISITEFDNVIDSNFELESNTNIISKQDLELLTDFATKNQINLSYSQDKKNTPILKFKQPELGLSDLKLKLSNNIFLQATKKTQDQIISIIKTEIGSKNISHLLDLYSGIGLYSFALSDLSNIKKITAIDANYNMTKLIGFNSKNNNLEHKINSKNQDLFRKPLSVEKLNNYDFAIINPPRKSSNQQIKNLADSKIKNIIMISCDLNSFIRDTKILTENGFSIKSITAIDQFYYSSHIEILAIFERK
jgi:23S rRNA (uracil1939-C5)-methyltransferase